MDPGPTAVPVPNLSDGYRVTLAVAVDIARRACALNPQLGTAAPTETEGVVLIDEIDLHLHPAWQRTVLRRLHRAFPKLQFVVTTHAPQVVIGTRTEEGDDLADVFVLDPGPDGSPAARNVDYAAGHSADDLLTGPWFKLHSTVDAETLRLMDEHSMLFKEATEHPDDADKQQAYQASLATLRRRLDGNTGSSVEELVMDVVLALSRKMGGRLAEMS